MIHLFLVWLLLDTGDTVVRHPVGKEDGTFHDFVGSEAGDPACRGLCTDQRNVSRF